MPDWPKPPIRLEYLPLIRELLSPEGYAALLKRIEDDPLRCLRRKRRACGLLF